MSLATENSEQQSVARLINGSGRGKVVLVCEHASHYIPPEYEHLGLEDDLLRSHIAWDPGALDTAVHMSALLDSPLVVSGVSRLVYDCNRSPEAESAIPEHSEIHEVPGNQNLSDAEKQRRVAQYYRPFETLLSETIARCGPGTVLVTVHSFTPIFKGERRDVEIGLLHDTDVRLASALRDVATGYQVRLNEPYGLRDQVTHTLQRHALPRNLPNVMIEIRNDLIGSQQQCAQMASTLVDWLNAALAGLDDDHARAVAK